MPTVTARGLRFHVQRLGDRSAPPVVLVHGLLTGNVATWYFGLGPALAPGRSVFMYDQRGHGRSERPPEGYGLAELTADLDALTADLGPVSLVGHSFGGLVALRQAIDRPDRVRAVVVVDTFASSGSGAAARTGAGIDEIRAMTRVRPGVADSHVPGAGVGDGGTERVRAAGRRHRPPADQVLLEETSVLRDVQADSWIDPADLARLAAPVLCILGSESPFRADVEALDARLPRERRERLVLRGGHAPHLDDPSRFAGAVGSFLDRVDPPAP